MRHSEINECWQEGGPDFFLFPPSLGQAVDVHEQGSGAEKQREERVWKKEGKALRGKQLLKRSNTGEGDTGEGDTLTSCMRCHGYVVCLRVIPFLHLPLQTYWHSRGKGKTQQGGGEREKGCKKGKRWQEVKIKMKMDKKETNEIRMRRCYDELWV